MGNRRLNLFVIVFVVGMLVASGIVIASNPTRLGLDLRGGVQLVYQGEPTPQNPEVQPEDIDRAIEIVRERVDKLGVSEPEIARVGSDQLQVGLPDVQDTQRAIDQVGDTAQLYFYDFEPNVVPLQKDVQLGDVTPSNVDQQRTPSLFEAVTLASKQKTPNDCSDCTTSGPEYYLFDDSDQFVAGPEQDKADLFSTDEAKALPEGERQVLTVPQGFIVVQDAPDTGADPESTADDLPPQYFVLRDSPALSGEQITDPKQNFDPQTNQPNVTFDFTDSGEKAFKTVTGEIADHGTNDINGQPYAFAIVLDDEIVSRATVDPTEYPTGIDGSTGAQISGSFTIQQAQDLANFLSIGALPVDLKLISQSTVSATLGQQALDAGLRAGLAGLILVILFLILYYRFLGVVAALGLLVYAAFFFALMKLIPITLTLPGIAGLILTIGVAADSNVVIFERIKEEIRAGHSTFSAITTGYRRGIGTIVDANVITLLTAFILYGLATAGVRGFAFTLGIGTIVSLFTAVVFTRAVLGTVGRTSFMSSPAVLGAGEQRFRWHFDFAGASRWFFSISGAILAISAFSFAVTQLNFGIDFESGTRIKVALAEDASVDDIRAALAEAGAENSDAAKIQSVEEPDFGANVFQIQTDVAPDQVGKVSDQLNSDFGLEGGENGFQSTSVGPTFGAQVARSAGYAIAFSLLLIAGYMAFRFEAKYAIPVMIAVAHDVLITAGVYSLSGREVTSATVAAFLTILGYSLYDTVIVFDRIRENVPRLPRATFAQIANRSLSEVLTRSLITGLSTVFLIAVILVFGGETLGDFAFAMMVGVLSGTYSSIFIATPVLIAWKQREPGYRARAERIREAMGRVPAFPEDNEVARVQGGPGRATEPAVAAGADRGGNGAPSEPEDVPAAPATAVATAEDDGNGAGPAVAEPEPEPERALSDEERARKAELRRRREARRRRKHGRNR